MGGAYTNDMNEGKLLKLLKDNFLSKAELDLRLGQIDGQFCEIRNRFDRVDTRLEGIEDSIEDLGASARVLDRVLEARPIERIARVEKHLGLQPYAAVPVED